MVEVEVDSLTRLERTYFDVVVVGLGSVLVAADTGLVADVVVVVAAVIAVAAAAAAAAVVAAVEY